MPSPTLSPPLSFRLVLTAFENFEYPWDAQGSGFLLLCLLNGLQVLFRAKQVVKNILQRSAPGRDSCECLGVWDSMGRCLEQWAPPVCFKLTPEQIQNPDSLVKYLQKVCCHPGNSRDTQINTMCWGLAHTYRAMFNLIQCPKGERGGNEPAAPGAAPPAGPAATPAQQAVTAPPTGTTAAAATGVVLAPPAGMAVATAPVPATVTVTKPSDQPVPVAVGPVKLKKDSKRADRSGRDDDEPGSSWEIEKEIITRSLSLSDLRHMRKDFSRHPGEHIVTWLLRC